MAKVKLIIEDDLMANAIALWFEDGDALDMFCKTKTYKKALELGASEISDTWCSVCLDDSGYLVEHDITIDTE